MPTVSARLIGVERQPVVVIDEFAPDAGALLEVAIASQLEPASQSYPGIRAALPPTYFANVETVLAGVMAEVFACRERLRILDASFSIVTHTPDALTAEQRIPHVDAVDAGRLAMVHYLSRDIGDGTAFYRHRATGFETVDVARAPAYFAQVSTENAANPPPPSYIAGNTDRYVRTACVDAAFNRAVIYRSGLLHSGAIAPGTTLSADPATGRLTVTAFFEAA